MRKFAAEADGLDDAVVGRFACLIGCVATVQFTDGRVGKGVGEPNAVRHLFFPVAMARAAMVLLCYGATVQCHPHLGAVFLR